jgi:hypothetical protein
MSNQPDLFIGRPTMSAINNSKKLAERQEWAREAA